VSNSAGKLGGGLDVRGNGGQVVAPGSRHKSGAIYAWAPERGPDDVELADGPPWLLDLLKPKPVKLAPLAPAHHHDHEAVLRRASGYLARIPPAIAGSGGHDQTWDAVIKVVRGFALDEETAFRLLRAEYNPRCTPPWPEKDLRHKIRDAIDKATMPPWGCLLGEERPQVEPARFREDPCCDDGDPTPVAAATWPDPVPLEQRPSLPAFPLDILPAWLHRFGDAVATETETDPSMTAMWLLSAVAIACARRFVIERGPRRCVHANLWSLTLLGSGAGKSPTLRAAHEPLGLWEQRCADELRDKIAAEATEERIARRRLEYLHRKAAQDKDADTRKAAQHEAEQIEAKLAGRQRVVAPMLSVQSATVARLQELLFEHGRFALVSDEASALEDLVRFERSGTPDLSSLNQAYDGADVRVARKKREDGSGGDRYARRAVLTLALSIQPGRALEELRGARAFFDSGFMQRFLVVYPEDRLGLRTHDKPKIPESVRAEYFSHLDELLGLPAVRDDVDFPAVQLAARASALLLRWQQETESNWKKGEDDTLRGWGSKLGDKLVRVAGLLHAAEHRRAPWTTPLGEETMQRALSLADFFLAHYRAFLFDARVDQVSTLALRAAAWMRKERLATFKRSELHMAVAKNGGAGTAELIERVLKLLEGVNHIRRAAPAPGRGRTPDLYDVNPKVLGIHDAE